MLFVRIQIKRKYISNLLFSIAVINYFLSDVGMLLISYFDAKKDWCIFFLAILKTNLLSHNLSKRIFILNLNFQRFFLYLWNYSNEIFLKSNPTIFIMYVIMSETVH